MHVHEKILRIVFAILLAAAALALASSFVDTSPEWYQSLHKPQLMPPPIVFGAAWVLIYMLFAASLALILASKHTNKKAFELFFITALLNALWPYTFFYLRNALGAMFVLGLILYCAIKLFLFIYSVNRAAAYLLIPFVVWVGFALYLNYELMFLN